MRCWHLGDLQGFHFLLSCSMLRAWSQLSSFPSSFCPRHFLFGFESIYYFFFHFSLTLFLLLVVSFCSSVFWSYPPSEVTLVSFRLTFGGSPSEVTLEVTPDLLSVMIVASSRPLFGSVLFAPFLFFKLGVSSACRL